MPIKKVPAARLRKRADGVETLERVERFKSSRRAVEGWNVRILSGEHGLYWLKYGQGYTGNQADAWVTDGKTAIAATSGAGPEKMIVFCRESSIGPAPEGGGASFHKAKLAFEIPAAYEGEPHEIRDDVAIALMETFPGGSVFEGENICTPHLLIVDAEEIDDGTVKRLLADINGCLAKFKVGPQIKSKRQKK